MRRAVPRHATAAPHPTPWTPAIGNTLIIAAIALVADALLGDPDWLFRRIGHPVTWLGALIAWTDRRLNRATLPEPRRRLNGVLALLPAILLPVLLAWLLQRACLHLLPRPAALAVLGLLAGTLPAQRSLWQHVDAVLVAMPRGLGAARAAVSRIVGRDPQSLDRPGIVRAAIESLAENFSDGVVAPLLWCALLGLPGIVFYKAVNTADSMIGHLTPRHASFGWAAARLDDLVNLPASRLSALFLVLACARRTAARRAVTALRRDARHHRSPNAGWPEAAMAGALDLRLAGPRSYGGAVVADAWMGRGRLDATEDDLRRALVLYRRACVIQAAIILSPTLLLALDTP